MSEDLTTLRAVLSARLKCARKAAGLSQKALGELIGLDAFAASTRINRYERGIHEPDLQTLARIADALGVPVAHLIADDERLARLILTFSNMSRREQDKMLTTLASGSY